MYKDTNNFFSLLQKYKMWLKELVAWTLLTLSTLSWNWAETEQVLKHITNDKKTRACEVLSDTLKPRYTFCKDAVYDDYWHWFEDEGRKRGQYEMLGWIYNSNLPREKELSLLRANIAQTKIMIWGELYLEISNRSGLPIKLPDWTVASDFFIVKIPKDWVVLNAKKMNSLFWAKYTALTWESHVEVTDEQWEKVFIPIVEVPENCFVPWDIDLEKDGRMKITEVRKWFHEPQWEYDDAVAAYVAMINNLEYKFYLQTLKQEKVCTLNPDEELTEDEFKKLEEFYKTYGFPFKWGKTEWTTWKNLVENFSSPSSTITKPKND